MTATSCRFDDSLPWLVDELVLELGPERVSSGVVLRDATGRLSFFCGTPLEGCSEDLAARIVERIGAYARVDRVVVGSDAPGASTIIEEPDAQSLRVGNITIRYIDRRIVGADWLRLGPNPNAPSRRFVFASLKGGVGRSTALSIVAADQARRGRNVLVVDLDLEAPGVGSMLLGSDRQPLLGAVDYLVERNIGPLTREDLELLVETSGVSSGAGLIDVVPVVGRRSQEEPRNFMAKLARGMLEEVHDAEDPISVGGKIAAMLGELEARRPYDLVLVDTRAGLAELAAGPLLQLGANVLLFGTSQRQTLDALRFLFAHLSVLTEERAPSPWRMLKMVHAKALLNERAQGFKDNLWELFSDYLYERLEARDLEGFNFTVDDPDAPHNPVVIPLDTAFADWDPTEKPTNLVETYYTRTFGDLLRYVDDLLDREAL